MPSSGFAGLAATQHSSAVVKRDRQNASRVTRGSAGGSLAGEEQVKTADFVELKRYQGRWYEVARLPLFWERKCARNVMATCTLRADGKIEVLHACRKANGQIAKSTGIAVPVHKNGPFSKLKVCFFWPFSGDYWILDLDPQYRWALVGTPNKRHLWLLSRTPALNPRIVEHLIGRAKGDGFDTSRLIFTRQT
jgi:apolipoprotein D and lipocalin family protein